MAAAEWYKDWFNSPFYHKLYYERDEEEAEKFIHRVLDYLAPPPNSRMVDIACGKGRHSRILASRDFDVTGIDISSDNISYAKRFETDHLHFFVHDMRLLFWVNYFHYAFNLFTSFGYFPTRREHDDAMRTIVGSLKKDGVLVIDYLNVHFVEDHLVTQEEKQIGNTVYAIERWHDEDHFYKKININDPSLSTPKEYTEKVAKFNLGDFTDLLSFQRMQVAEVFGNYQLGPYDVRKTPRMIIIAKKL